MLTSLIINLWIGFGAFINKVVTTPPSPLTTEGCRLNMTTSVATTTMIGALTAVAPPADDKDE